MNLKYRIGYLFFTIFGEVFSVFGYSKLKFASNVLAFMGFYLFMIRKKIVISNLTIAFPNLSSKEIKNLAFNNFRSIATTFLEIYLLKKWDAKEIKQIFSDAGFDIIRKKLDENKGLILLTAHFGNWEMGAVASGLHLNENINVLVKKQKNPFVAEWLNDFRERFGNKQIPLGASVRELYKTIKQKKIVGVVGDQRGKRDGINVIFFGRETKTFAGTATIAIKTKCPVYVLLCARMQDGTYKAIIREIDTNLLSGSREEQVQQFNQLYMSILENAIKKYPEQWFWMHNIWKY